ncbi:MAG: Spo0E family sporulation regulatory protein-aspartic acid phosphatase [Lachnospiraceae bacterium]
MKMSKEELVISIEEAREKLNNSIDGKEDYEEIYKKSVALDRLIEQYIVYGF